MSKFTTRQRDSDPRQHEAGVTVRDLLADSGAAAHPAALAWELFGRTRGIDLPDRPAFADRPPPIL
jgi:hypothetical protein